MDTYHSVTTRATVMKVEKVVFVLGRDGVVTPMTEDQFESGFKKVAGDLFVRSRANGKVYEGHRTEKGGFLVHGQYGVEAYDTQEEVEKLYEVKQ